MKIALINYLNSIPYVHAVNKYQDFFEKILIVSPAEGADLFMQHKVDVALLPIATLPQLEHIYRFPYGIGATGEVKSVLLASTKPLDQIKIILLDIESRTSNVLIQILCRFYWNISPKFTTNESDNYDAQVVIGDKAFSLPLKNYLSIDLAQAWIEFSRKPMVFARWIAWPERIKNHLDILQEIFNFANTHKKDSLFLQNILPEDKALSYLTNNISYVLTPIFDEGEKLFFEFLKKIKY
jgi:chorismate dehydratase